MTFRDFQKQVQLTRAHTEAKRAEYLATRRRHGNVARRKSALGRRARREADNELPALARLETELGQASIRAKSAWEAAARFEWQRHLEYEQYTNPVFNIGSLDDDCPILLVPLRLETRFKRVPREGGVANQLWVRIFPDDIAIDSFESDLSATELRNIRQYWAGRWHAGGVENGNRAAWRALASSHGPGRAWWLVQNYRPLNAADEPEKAAGEIILAIPAEVDPPAPEKAAVRAYWSAVWKADRDARRLAAARANLEAAVGAERAAALLDEYRPVNRSEPPPDGMARDDTAVRVEFVLFPPADELDEKLHGWSQPPSATILPERFVFLGYRNGELALPPQAGNLIPPRLILGPDPAADEGEDFRFAEADEAGHDEGELIYAEHLKWLFDFDAAVDKGMGLRIDLTPELASGGFDRVFVVGIKLGADKGHAKCLLEELLQQHQSSRKGLSILKQGTPTNNTESADAGYSWRHDPDDSFDRFFGEGPPPDDPDGWFDKRDGRWLAEMLGIDADALRDVDNYYGTDLREGRAMQRALWPATLGHFMDSMMQPVFGKSVIEDVRQFFTHHVSGRGGLPAIRIGRQPYGILPATAFTRTKWLQSRRPGIDGGFLAALYTILIDIDAVWTSLRQRVSFIGKAGDPHQILLDVVGLHPDSAELYKRYANSIKQLHNMYSAAGYEHGGMFAYYATSFDPASALLARYGYTIDEQNPAPEILSKSFFENSWILKGPRIDKLPNTEDQAISAWTADGRNYIGWLLDAARDSHDQLRRQEGFIDDKPPTALLYLLLYHALDLSYIDTSLNLHRSKAVMSDAEVALAYVEPDFIHIEAGNETESRWKYLYKAEERITGDPQQLLGDYIPLNLDTLDEAAAFRDALAGLEQLEHAPTSCLERAMMEHIDTVSWRYDAWMAGLVNLQLTAMRGIGRTDEESQSRQGLYLGAYGWLEDLRPDDRVLGRVTLPPELKAVFDPHDDLVSDSTNAGYLLAPSQNHAVTAAVLRNGHLSNALPANRERLNVNLSSNRVRLALQVIAGIQGGQPLAALLGYRFERGLHDRTDAEVDEFIFELRRKFPLTANKLASTVPDDDEYDSISEVEARNVIDGAALLAHIADSNSPNYPFGLPLPDASDRQSEAIDDEVRKLMELNDAVADLALAESVHQAVSGNYERAAATLDAYSKGHLPPTPEVIETPRSGTILTHRVSLHFKPGIVHDIAQPRVTPRQHAEPAVDHWVSAMLPAMDEIVCVVDYVDAATGAERREVSMQDLGLAPIDVLYLLDVGSDQAMTALDDRVVHFSHTTFATRIGDAVGIGYTERLTAGLYTVFEISSLVASLRALVLSSRPLNAADILPANEAARDHEQTTAADPARLQPLVAKLDAFRTGPLGDYRNDVRALIAGGNAGDIVDELDRLMAELAALFVDAGSYGLPQTGTGFLYQWRESMRNGLAGRIAEVVARWETALAGYTALIDEYNGVSGVATDEELFAILTRAELKISTAATQPPPAAPADFLTLIQTNRLAPFSDFLANRIRPLDTINSLTDVLNATAAVAADMAPFDILGFDIADELRQVLVFVNDLARAADSLDAAIERRVSSSQSSIDKAAATGDARARADLICSAAKALLGDDFVLVPEFTVNDETGNEWSNTLDASDHSLRYLHHDLDTDFPVDDWLHGLARVREKLGHVEDAVLHAEGFGGAAIDLVPAQFPYRENDYWLGLQFPETDPDTGEPFTIGEDKLLYTAAYAVPFDRTANQCGLLLDEWTEMIPSRDETAGLAFHYDQPNSEPPQALLLVTPSDFTGKWRWNDLVDTLHETLDMAKKRAVEPDHVDGSVYGRFLPPIVSPSSPLPVTATLNLALNNEVFFAKLANHE